MSYEIFQSVSIRDDKIYVTSAASNAAPMVFRESERIDLTTHYQNGGLHAVLKVIGDGIFQKKIIMRPHNCQLAEHLKYAAALIQPPLSLYLDAPHAGEFIATVAYRLHTETMFSPAEDLKKLELLRSDPVETLKICINNPRAFIFSETNVRRDHDLAMQYIDLCVELPGFSFPSYFKDDKELAMKVLKYNGLFFYELGPALRNDKAVALFAYSCRCRRANHASDPVYIGESLLNDQEFLCELCRICPILAVERAPFILQDVFVAKEWLLHNQSAFEQLELLPTSVLKYVKIRNALYSLSSTDKARCERIHEFIFQRCSSNAGSHSEGPRNAGPKERTTANRPSKAVGTSNRKSQKTASKT